MKSLLFSGRVCFLIYALSALPLWAQDATQAQRQHEQRLKEEQDRLRDRLERDQPTQDVFLQPDAKPETNDLPTDEQSPCIQINLISVQGVTILDQKEVDNVTRTYLGKCLRLGDINQLIAGISNLYLNRGYITSRAFVQPQKIENGNLDLLVIEGKIEKLQSSNMKQRELDAAFPVEEKTVLNLRDLEQGIENLNRLQQNSAQLDIQPGSDTGLSLVNIANQSSRPLHAQIFVDNSGSEATGQYLTGVSLSWDNPIHASDSLYLTFSKANDAAPGGSSQSYAINYSIPQGYFLWTISANHFDYQQQIAGASVNFMTSGDSDNQSLGLDYVAARSQRSKWTISSDLSHKVSKNYIEDVFLDTSSRELYLASVGINHTYKLSSAMLRSGLTWTQSFKAGNATEKLAEAEADYQFDKYQLNLGIYGGFEIAKQAFQYNSSINYFYTADPIIASEALSLGGQYSVRGYDQESLSGFKGGYWRTEISWPKTLWQQIRLEPMLGYDIGQSDAPDYNQDKATLSGGTIGLRINYKTFSANASYAKALAVPEFFTKEQSVFIFDARVSF